MVSRAWLWPGGKVNSIALRSIRISANRSILLTWRRRSPRGSARRRTRSRCQLQILSRRRLMVLPGCRLARREKMTLSSESDLHHIVVVGGGAGGLELVTRLGDRLAAKGKARVTLVERSRTHL